LAVTRHNPRFSCRHSDLRGSWSKSEDGFTYLVVAEKNCDDCPMLVDGRRWKYAVGEAGRIDPGTHRIENPGEIEFTVPAGTIYRFKYWGP
jgi:hypothetical protein